MIAVLDAPPSFRRPLDWKLRGACSGSPTPDLWFDDDPVVIEAAKAVCAGCSMRSLCLDDALARGEAWGVLGGLTPSERRRIADASDEVHRPSAAGRWQHGQPGAYRAHGCRCQRCREAHAAYQAHYRRQRRWVATSRGLLVPTGELDRPAGRGRVRAWPGQTYLEVAA